MMRRLSHFVLLAVLLFACTSNPPGGDAGRDPLTPDERQTYDRGSPAVPAYVELVSLSDRMFKFDPTLDVNKTAQQNAQAIKDQIIAELGSNGDGGAVCGNVAIAGSVDAGVTVTVTATFPSSGCKLGNMTISGTVTLGVMATSGMVSIAVSFTNVIVDGTALSGTATFTTSNATTFTLVANVTYGSNSFSTVPSLTVTGATGSITIDGNVTVGAGETQASVTFVKVVWKQGDCYPSSGSLAIKKGLLAQTVTFLSTTPATAQVQVKTGKKTTTECLPPYGTCGAGCTTGTPDAGG